MIHIQKILATIAVLFVVVFIGCSNNRVGIDPNQNATNQTTASIDALFTKINRPDSPGAAVLVIKDGLVLHRKGYGSANLEHQVPITPESVFDIASMSKQFTGMAISMLVEQKVINLEDDIRKYIPELPDYGQTITVRHLVHHMSGVRDFFYTMFIAGWGLDDVFSSDQILTMASHQQTLNFEPGERYDYSNTGYFLLAEMVKRVTGKTLAVWTEQNLFVPMGMKNTYFRTEHTDLIPRKAYGYSDDGEGKFMANANGLSAPGPSSLFTTIDDLGKWVTNFDTHSVGGAAVIQRMQTRGVLDNGDTIDYGYGVFIGNYRGHKTLAHHGVWLGYNTKMLHFPEQRLSIVILGNFENFNPSGSANQIADLFLSDVPTEVQKQAQSLPKPQNPTPPRATSLDDYVGTYKLWPHFFFEITRQGDQLLVAATHEAKHPMVVVSQDVFNIPAYRSKMKFRRNAKELVTQIEYGNSIMERLEAWSPSVKELSELTGQYYSDELDTSYWLELIDGGLVAKHRRHPAIELRLLGRNEFEGNIWFASGFKFIRDKSGNTSTMLISNRRSFNNKFRKINI
jgi:CubicO group peptidase (beta-lactamase class C family)